MLTTRVGPAWLVVAFLGGASLGVVLVDLLLRLSLPVTVGDAVPIISAAALVAAAWAAVRSARDSQRAAQATLYTEIMSRYSSPEMAEALRYLANLQTIAEPSLEKFAASWAQSIASGRPISDQVREIDHHRRRVAHLFWDASLLVNDGLITEGLRQELLDLSGRTIMRDVVLVLEVELHKAEKTPSPTAMHKVERFLSVFCPGETITEIKARAAQKYVEPAK